jgi:hypothetical protein
MTEMTKVRVDTHMTHYPSEKKIGRLSKGKGKDKRNEKFPRYGMDGMEQLDRVDMGKGGRWTKTNKQNTRSLSIFVSTNQNHG